MSQVGTPLIEMSGVIRAHGGPHPLRIASFRASIRDRRVLDGFDEAASETFFHLVSGAALPDEGTVIVGGTDTRAIATDTEWLVSLDRFGFMTHRSVMLDTLSVAANLALPLTLDVEPLPLSIRRDVELVADDVGLARTELDVAAGDLDALGRARLRLGRAVSARPELLLLEDPTRELRAPREREAFGLALARTSERRELGWIALSGDAVFARASGGRRERLDVDSGRVAPVRSWWPWR